MEILLLLLVAGPILAVYALLSIKYEVDNEFFWAKMLGVVSRKIPLNNIESYEKFNQIPFLKGRFEDMVFNKAVLIRLKEPQFLAKFYVAAPKDREAFMLELERALSSLQK